MSWITPITNHADGEAYEHEDLNRVGSNIQYLADLLHSFGYAVTVSPKTDWEITDIPILAQMATYLADLNALKAAFYGTTPLPGSMDNLTAEQANNIERLLIETETNINRMILSFWGCAEIGCGET
ncbi:MAG: hypothetical protein VB064_04805 [Oscillospiraceae bacterium]|nr:hypothetical protein [Oscillospiraceae bacterium]